MTIKSVSDPFFSEPVTLTVAGRVITIAPLPVKHLAQAGRLAAPLVVCMAQWEFVNVLALLERTDDLIALVSLATQIEAEWLGERNAAELVQIASTVMQVNADFFTHHLAPALQTAFAGINQHVTDGAAPSSTSSGTDTALATSATTAWPKSTH